MLLRLLGWWWLASGQAAAQPLELAPQRGEVRDLVTVQRPDRFRAGDAWAVTVAQVDAAGSGELAPALTGGMGVAIQDRVRLDLTVPMRLDLDEVELAGWGPVRVASQVVLVRPVPKPSGADGLGLGLVPWVRVPTGGDGPASERLSGGAFANATVGLPRLTLTGQAGLDFQPLDDLERADQAVLGAGMAWEPFDRVAMGLEGRLTRTMNQVTDPWSSPAEATLSLRRVGRKGALLLGGVTADVRQEDAGLGFGALRVFLGGGLGRAHDPDPDQDGVLVVADRCPEDRETHNGYRDDDGCPDELASLGVVPLHREQVRREARILATDAEARHEGKGVVWLEDLMPGEPVDVRAELGCLAGEVRGRRLSQGENTLLVDMTPRFTSHLRFVVVGEDGLPLKGARIRWLDGGPGCSPLESLELPAGKGEVRVGAAIHRVVVEAPDHRPRAFAITVPRGIEEAVQIPLVAR